MQSITIVNDIVRNNIATTYRKQLSYQSCMKQINIATRRKQLPTLWETMYRLVGNRNRHCRKKKLCVAKLSETDLDSLSLIFR